MKKRYSVMSYGSERSVDWSTVPAAQIDNYGWQSAEKFEARAQLVLVKGQKFVCRMVCLQPDPWANCNENGDKIWLDSVLELFVKFGADGYLNVEMNSRGNKLEEFGESRQMRTRLSGITTVTARKACDSWQLEVTLPLSKVKSLYHGFDTDQIKEGFEFGLNFYKTGLDPKTGLSHYGMWNPVESERPDFHRPDQFGTGVIV